MTHISPCSPPCTQGIFILGWNENQKEPPSSSLLTNLSNSARERSSLQLSLLVVEKEREGKKERGSSNNQKKNIFKRVVEQKECFIVEYVSTPCCSD